MFAECVTQVGKLGGVSSGTRKETENRLGLVVGRAFAIQELLNPHRDFTGCGVLLSGVIPLPPAWVGQLLRTHALLLLFPKLPTSDSFSPSSPGAVTAMDALCR